jgi:hypothetical protein
MKSASKSFMAASVCISLVLLSSFGTSRLFAYETIPGGDCRAANLSQARFLAWNQFGVSNPNPIGGQSYFVLCNLHRDGDQDLSPIVIFVAAQYNNTTANNLQNIPVLCTFRDINAAFPSGAAVINLQTQTIGSADFINPLLGPHDVDVERFEIPISDEDVNQQNFVCALHPQTQINMIHLEY